MAKYARGTSYTPQAIQKLLSTLGLRHCRWETRALARKEKNSTFSMNWELKHSWVPGFSVSPSLDSVGDFGSEGGGGLHKFATFSLKLVWYSLLKIIKLKLSVTNKKLLLRFNICTVMFVFGFSLVKTEAEVK